MTLNIGELRKSNMHTATKINRILISYLKQQNRLIFGLMGVMLTLSLGGCGKPFNVQPKPQVTPANYQVSGEANGVSVDAEAFTDEDKLYDTFEANLILAGVLPVRLRLTNTQTDNIELKKARFTVKSQNQIYKAIDAKSAYKRLMKYYSISIYNKAGYKESRDDFSAYEINLKNRLAANEKREGLMFFAVPGDVVQGNDLTLVIAKLSAAKEKVAQPIELKLK